MNHNLFITGRCNLACYFCFADSLKKIPDDRPAILEAAANTEAETVFLCGGEPFNDWPWLQEVIEALPANTRKVINTNGRLFRPEFAPWLNSRGVEVMLSVDGYDRGERPLSALKFENFSGLEYLHVNQILFYPEDIAAINQALRPGVHSVCLNRFDRDLSPAQAEALAAKIPAFVWFDKIDPNVFSSAGDYNEITTFQTGKSYGSSPNPSTYCTHTQARIGRAAWEILRRSRHGIS